MTDSNPYDGKGIDPGLIPFLLAAEEPDEPDQEEPAGEDEESDRVRALRALVESSLLSGPDPDLIAELLGEIASLDEPEEEDHEEAAARAVSAVELRDRVRDLAEELFARAPEHRFEPTLDRVERLMDILGDPQEAYPSVHLAGTNGKTSTSRMIDALLGAFDLRVGRFTSPHLRDVRERITIGGEPVTAEQFLAAWNDIAPYVDMIDAQSAASGGPRMSFFEVLTAMALAAFADYPVDVAVVECGMGGVWDATNVLDSGVAVLTSISLDHQQWLGDTIEQIAVEKAGIIKDRTIVVSMEQPPSVVEIIESRCRETDSILWLEGRDWEVLSRQLLEQGQIISVRTPAGVYEDLFLPLHGQHQAHNAGAALVATESIMGGKTLSADLVDRGFHAISSPGRMEILRRSPTVVVDSAHNPGGAVALRAAMEETFDFDFTAGVFSAMGDKNVEAVLAEMEPAIDELVVTQLPGERAMPLEKLVEIASDVFGPDRVHAEETLADAIDRAAALVDSTIDRHDAKGIVVFGSVVLAGEATELLKPDHRIG